jgi:hypothetical protein
MVHIWPLLRGNGPYFGPSLEGWFFVNGKRVKSEPFCLFDRDPYPKRERNTIEGIKVYVLRQDTALVRKWEVLISEIDLPK